MHYAERELFRYTKGSVREHNLLKKQFVHTKFLLNLENSLPALRPSLRFGTPLPIGDVALTRCAIASICIALA